MDKNDMNEDQENKDPKFEDDSSDDDIPLWLQGLVSNDQDDQASNESEDVNQDTWIPELSNELEHSDDDQNIKEEDDFDTPLETVSKGNNAQGNHEKEPIDGNYEEIDIDKLPNGSYSNDIGPTIDDIPSSEGFVDISEMETTEFSIQDEPILEDEPLVDGDLPEWLQEMIAEQEQPKTTDIDKEVIDNNNLVEESPTYQAPTLQEPLSDEDDTQEEDLLIFNDELDEEEAFLADIESSSKPGKDVDTGWFSEQDDQAEERVETDKQNLISNETSYEIDDIAANEMADYETQPIKVSTEDNEPSSSTLDDSFDDDTPSTEDEIGSSGSFEDLYIEDSPTHDREFFSPWSEEPSVREPFDQIDDKEPDDPFDEASRPTKDEEIPSQTIKDSSEQRTFEREYEDDHEADQDEPSLDELYSIKDEKESSQTFEEPFYDDPFSDDEVSSLPPFGVPYEQENITKEDKNDSLSGSGEETFDQENFAIDDKEEGLPEIDETPFDKHHQVGDGQTPPSEEPNVEDLEIDKKEDISHSLKESLIEELLAAGKEEDRLASREEIPTDETYSDLEDDVLTGLKLQIEQGHFENVITTINEQIEDASHLDKLELWIREATESPLERKSELWETLGDINLKQNKPEEAFDAYTKAIKHLLAS